MSSLKENAFTISVVDARGQYVDGAQVQLFVGGIPKVQGYVRKGKPFVVQLSEGVITVEVSITVGEFRSRETVPTNQGSYRVTVPDQYLPKPDAAQASAPNLPSVSQDNGSGTWLRLLGIVLPLVAGLIAAYWQFVYKPVHQPKTVQLGIIVKDNATGNPIQTAHVILVRAARSEDRPTDSLGTARFAISPDESKNLRVEASATGYASGSREIDAPTSDTSFYIFLSPQMPPSLKSGEGPPREQAPTSTLLTGTWEVAVLGDINNARLQKGTFNFSPQHDGSILLSANMRVDAMDVNVTGKASMTQHQVLLNFAATTSAGGSWTGQGELTLLPDNNHLTGRIQSKRGDDIPVTLNKL